MLLFAASQCGELIQPSHNILIPKRWRSLSTRHVLNSVWWLSAIWLADGSNFCLILVLVPVHASNIVHCSHSHQLHHWLKDKQVAHLQVQISFNSSCTDTLWQACSQSTSESLAQPSHLISSALSPSWSKMLLILLSFFVPNICKLILIYANNHHVSSPPVVVWFISNLFYQHGSKSMVWAALLHQISLSY